MFVMRGAKVKFQLGVPRIGSLRGSVRCEVQSHVVCIRSIRSLLKYSVALVHIKSLSGALQRVKVACYLNKFSFYGCIFFPDVTFSLPDPPKNVTTELCGNRMPIKMFPYVSNVLISVLQSKCRAMLVLNPIV